MVPSIDKMFYPYIKQMNPQPFFLWVLFPTMYTATTLQKLLNVAKLRIGDI